MRSANTQISITKTCLYNFDPLKTHFYIIVKLGLTGVYIIFLISAQKHRLWVHVKTASPRWFSRVLTTYVLIRNMKNIRIFLSENFHFLVVKFSVYLNRHAFVMDYANAVRLKTLWIVGYSESALRRMVRLHTYTGCSESPFGKSCHPHRFRKKQSFAMGSAYPSVFCR